MLDYVFHLPIIDGAFFVSLLMAVVGFFAVYMLNGAVRREEKRKRTRVHHIG